MAKKMIIKGVGTIMAKRKGKDGKGKEVVTLGTLQDLRITLNTDIEDIFGGDGLFPIDDIVTSKSIEITGTDAKFDLGHVELMYGSTVQDGVESYVTVLNEQNTATSGVNGEIDGEMGGDPEEVKVAVFELAKELYTGAEGAELSVRDRDAGVLLEEVPYEEDIEPAIDTFMQDGGTIYLNKENIGMDFVVSYRRPQIVDMVALLTDEIPFPVSIIHHGSYMQKDETFANIETELFACRAQGAFSIDAARRSASSSAINLKLIDPERADGKLGTIKTYTTSTKD